MHGGTVRAESEEGRGSTFRVTIKAGSAHLPADRLVPEGPARAGRSQATAYLQEAMLWSANDPSQASMGGPTLARRLAHARPHMKVLCMSGYTDDSVVRHGLMQGEVAFVQKPFTPDSLGRKVRAVLDA